MSRTILEDLEEKVPALRELHARLRDRGSGESFDEVRARARLAD